ncbi:MAG: UDP-N-acetylmuramate--L-alanine ligase [Cyanobacteria bacterium SIG29]|nr:UDP-N-acetylmuramate--L-alanine ligase [Cyanobacteria bacterium SIG29]
METLNRKFHFIAIGGVGMSALAKYLVERGAKVSGSDIQDNKYTHLLEEKGVKISIGHDANLIEKDAIIVASTAIKSSNPEIIRAKELGLKIYHRSDILKMISDEFSQNQNSTFFGFSGTHGKTTTSGLCAYVLEKGELNPSYVVGGIIPEINTNGKYNENKFFSAELDESDGTIKKYSTDIAIINNMEEDHLDFYKNGFSDILKTFNEYLSNKPNQKVIINNDNSGNCEFMSNYPNYNYITFGLNNADYMAKNIEYNGLESNFDIYYKEEKIDSIKLSILGEHNVYNALAVYSALHQADINTKEISKHFYSFTGMGRRFQKVCEFNDIKIYDDYAHHPSEIKTTLDSVKNALKDNARVVAIFQPHRYSRLQGLWNEFKTCFDSADKLLVIDVYSAGEDKIEGISSEKFANEINHKDCNYISGGIVQNANKIYPLLQKNDIVITLGAGTVTKIGSLIEKCK